MLALRPADRHSRCSLSLTNPNQSYENISFVIHHRAGGCRVCQLLSVTEERGDCGDDHDNHSPRRGQENDSEGEDDRDSEAEGDREDDAAADDAATFDAAAFAVSGR